MAAQSRSVSFERGIYVVRYAVAEDNSAHPKVKLSILPPNRDSVSFISLDEEPGEIELLAPGSSVVLLVRQPSDVTIEVIPLGPSSSSHATVKIDRITQGSDPFQVLGARRDGQEGFDLNGLKLSGHMAGRGDVSVGLGEWLGGPTSPARIEGVSLEWPRRPPGIDIRYAAILGQRNSPDNRLVSLGNFVGSRGRAIPIVSLTIEVDGEKASDMEMVAEALFLGAPLMRVSGHRIIVTGPSRREALVGLRLNLRWKRDFEAVSTGSNDDQNEAASPARVRVFRRKGKTGAA